MLTKKIGGLWIGASQIVLLIVNFLFLKLLTTNLSVEDFGYYSLIMSIVLFARQIIYDPISITVAKRVGASTDNLLKISSGFEIVKFFTDRCGLALVLFGLAIYLLAVLATNKSASGLTVLICTLYLCANGAQGIYINLFNSFGDRRAAALFSISDSFFKISIVYFVLFSHEKNLNYVLTSIAMGAFFVFTFLRGYVAGRFAVKFLPQTRLKKMVKKIILMSSPFYVPTIFMALKSISDRWILVSFTGAEELAMYSVLQQIGYSPILLFFGVVQTFFGPIIYRLSLTYKRTEINELARLLNKLLLSIFIATCFGAFAAIFFAEWLLHLLTGSAYHNLAVYMPFFIVSGAFAAATGILQVVAIGIFKANIAGKLMSTSVIFSVLISLLFIIKWGFIGSIGALFFSSASSALIYYCAINREFSCSK